MKYKEKEVTWKCQGSPHWSLAPQELTANKASAAAGRDLVGAQGDAVNLQAGDSSLEVAPVPDPRAHARRVVGRESNPADAFARHGGSVHEQLGGPSRVVVGGADVLPLVWGHATAQQGRRESARAPTRKAHEQSSGSDHPQVHAPGARVVVEDRPRPSLVIHPRQDRDGPAGVQFACVRELYVAASVPEEFVRGVAAAVGSWGCPDVS